MLPVDGWSLNISANEDIMSLIVKCAQIAIIYVFHHKGNGKMQIEK